MFNNGRVDTCSDIWVTFKWGLVVNKINFKGEDILLGVHVLLIYFLSNFALTINH